MTGPIELLEERFNEIKEMKSKAMSRKDKKKITNLYNQYYACIKILKEGINLKHYRKKNDTKR